MGRYRIREKPLKFIEKGNLEVLLFNLQSKMRAHNKVSQANKQLYIYIFYIFSLSYLSLSLTKDI